MGSGKYLKLRVFHLMRPNLGCYPDARCSICRPAFLTGCSRPRCSPAATVEQTHHYGAGWRSEARGVVIRDSGCTCAFAVTVGHLRSQNVPDNFP